MRVLAFAASLREQSSNRRLIEQAAAIARAQGAEVDLADFHEFEMPLYNADVQETTGFPPGTIEMCARIARADALMIATPEYNYSIPGVLKNAIDWVSRIRPMPWRGKSTYLMSASPAAAGGIRGLWQTRIPLEGCGALVFPDMFALPHAHQAFDPDGHLQDQALAERLEKEIIGFLHLAEAIAPLWGEPRSLEDLRRQHEVEEALEDETLVQAQPMVAV